MLSLPDRASVERAIAEVEGELSTLLTDRLAISVKNEVADLTHYLIIRTYDEEGAIIAAAGFSPLVNPIDQSRFPDPNFHPWWDWLDDLGNWFEMIVAAGDSGFAFVLLIEKGKLTLSPLAALCHRYIAPRA